MRIPLDRQGSEPLYRQIETFLRQGILSGALAPGTRLPAIRQLAHDLGINRITVETAYAELEADGLIEARVGSGTYVLPPYPSPPTQPSNPGKEWPLWQQELPREREIWQAPLPHPAPPASWHSPLIDFANGTGDPALFPAQEFRKIIPMVLRRDGTAALEYGEQAGYAPLRNTIAHVLASQGLQASPETVLITSGSQQAMALISQLLLRPGDTIVAEGPTYSGAVSLFRALGAQIVTVATDEQGMQVEQLETLLQQYHPRLIYCIPNFHNPTGTCLSSYRRRQLIVLADRYNVPILEDDFVGDLRYEGRAQPALKALDPGGRVLYTSTFSKMLMPGLRVGFVVADGPVCESLTRLKNVTDLATSNLMQRVLEAYVTVGRYQAHLRHSCRVYRRRRDVMLSAIEHEFPVDVQIHPPEGGLFLWLRLPEQLPTGRLWALAGEEGVTFAPGSLFYPAGQGGEHALRLNFACQPPDAIEEGIRRLAKAARRLATQE